MIRYIEKDYIYIINSKKMLIKNSKNNDIVVVVKENDSAGITTPSAPRARNTSDIGDGDADSASAACATIASFASLATFGYNPGIMSASSSSSSFQASPAMIMADGMYYTGNTVHSK